LHIVAIIGGGLLCGGSVSAAAADTGPILDLATSPSWSWDLTSGFDSYLHSYALATDDTTETLAEFMVQAGLEGQSAYAARHRWRLRAEASAGTELVRQRVIGEYRLRGADKIDRLRLNANFWGRQYRQGTEYSRSSDNWEGRLEGRVAPFVGRVAKLEVRGWSGLIDYRTPSTLEVDYRDTGGGVFVRSTARGATLWGVGARAGNRTYPDSMAINRDTRSLEADLDHHDLQGRGLRLYHRSQRRRIRDESVRPAAWTHWTDFAGAVTAGDGHVFLEMQAEVWQYDEQNEIYFNSTRLEGAAGYRWGDILSATWKVAVAGERLDAPDSPETYSQLGLRAGVESYGAEVSGSVTLEYGRRVYAQGEVSLDAVDAPTLEATLLDTILLYSDFNYWKIWLLGSWRISPQMDLDLMANYEPENHTEKSDDSALGFASIRLRWRP
jgi:hypothetical protein